MRQNALLPTNNTVLSARKKESIGENVAEIKEKNAFGKRSHGTLSKQNILWDRSFSLV